MARVLLVDDDAAFREQVETLLAERVPGVEIVASVGDAHAAVAEAMRTAPAAVVIDYAMPGPHGGHAAAVIRQALPGACVVILSGLPREQLADVPEGVEVVEKGAGMAEALTALLSRQP